MEPMETNVPTLERRALDFAERRVLFRAKDLTAAGIPSIVLTRLIAAHKIERLARGVYALVDAPVSLNRSLAEVSMRAPAGVICLLSALRYHEIGTQLPFAVWVAIPRGGASPKIDSPQVRFIRMAPQAIEAGVQSVDIDGVPVRIFSVAKTVTDCFKYRNTVGVDVAIEALREAWRQRMVTIDDLWRYALVNRVSNVMRPYLETLTT